MHPRDSYNDLLFGRGAYRLSFVPWTPYLAFINICDIFEGGYFNDVLFFCSLSAVVTFSFRQPMYVFMENIMTATVNIDRTGSTDQAFTLSVIARKFGHVHPYFSLVPKVGVSLCNLLMFSLAALQGETGMVITDVIVFGPDDTDAEISFNVTDDLIALEATERLEWSITLTSVTDRASVSPFDSTVVLIVDDDGNCLSCHTYSSL